MVDDLRIRAALVALPESLRHEYMLAAGEHRGVSYQAAAEDAFLVAGAFIKESLITDSGAIGPHLVDPTPIVSLDQVTMPPCADGRISHYPNPQGRCTGCGIDIDRVRESVRRNRNRQDARERRAEERAQKQKAG